MSDFVAKCWAILLAVMLCAGCHRPGAAPAKAAPPAKVDHIAKEGDLNTIELTPEAEVRLGIKLAAVERKAVQRRRTYGGELVLPTGASIIVSAPVGGRLEAISEGNVLEVGAHVGRNDPVFLLVPLALTPAEQIAVTEARLRLAQAQVDADTLLEQAQTNFDLAETNLKRAEGLLGGGGTKERVDTAKGALDNAKAELDRAKQRVKLVEGVRRSTEAGDSVRIPIVSPRDGYVRLQHATVGEIVPAGAPLFEVIDFDPIWVKVPIYAGELPSIADNEPARVSALGESDTAKALTAQAVQAPPSADALAATVDLYYELDNPDGRLRPGQRLNVTLTLRGEQESLVVPWSAVEIDFYGGAWVYVMTAPHRFVRRRVLVPFVADHLAVLEKGLAQGEQVVIEGVAELSGTEFGAGH